MPRKSAVNAAKLRAGVSPSSHREPQEKVERPVSRRVRQPGKAKGRAAEVAVPPEAPAPDESPKVEAAPAGPSQTREAFQPYQVEEDPLDPGSLIVQAAAAEARRQLHNSREEASRLALDEFRHRAMGPARPARPGGALVVLSGPPGLPVPSRAPLRTSRRGIQARLRRGGSFVLGTIRETWGITERGIARDLAGVFATGGSAPSPEDAEPLSSVWFGLHLPGLGLAEADSTRSRSFSGLLWDLPPALSLRVAGVRILGADGSIPVRWVRDRDGRLYVPPRKVASPWPERPGPLGSGSACWLVVDLAIEAGELGHCGKAWLNVASARPLDPMADWPTAPGSLVAPVGSRTADLTVEQPFAGWPGSSEEDPSAARHRFSNAFRHRGRAVTADDFINLLTERWPTAVLLEVSPTRVRVGSAYEDAVRLTIVPRSWRGPVDLLARALVMADRAARFLAPKAPLGVRVLVGPPSLRVAALPAPSDPLWPYREYLHVGSEPSACRRDGVFWPVHDPADLRGASQ